MPLTGFFPPIPSLLRLSDRLQYPWHPTLYWRKATGDTQSLGYSQALLATASLLPVPDQEKMQGGYEARVSNIGIFLFHHQGHPAILPPHPGMNVSKNLIYCLDRKWITHLSSILYCEDPNNNCLNLCRYMRACEFTKSKQNSPAFMGNGRANVSFFWIFFSCFLLQSHLLTTVRVCGMRVCVCMCVCVDVSWYLQRGIVWYCSVHAFEYEGQTFQAPALLRTSWCSNHRPPALLCHPHCS